MNSSEILSIGISIASIIIAGLAYWNSRRQHNISTNPAVFVRPRLERLTDLYSFDGSINKSHVLLGSRIEIDIRNDDLSTRVTALNISLTIQIKLGWFEKEELQLYTSEVEYLEPRGKMTVRNWYADEEFIGYLELALLQMNHPTLHYHPELRFTRQPPNIPYILNTHREVTLIFNVTYQPALFGVKQKKIIKEIRVIPATVNADVDNLLDGWEVHGLN